MPRKIINLQELRSLQEALERSDARAIVSLLFHGDRDETDDDVTSYGVPAEKLNVLIAQAPKCSYQVLAKVVDTTVARINELEAKAKALDTLHHGPSAKGARFRNIANQLRGFCRRLGNAFDASRPTPAPSPDKNEETAAA